MGYGSGLHRRRSGIYETRVFIPLALREKFDGRREIRTSTRTNDRRAAALIAFETLLTWKRRFAELISLDVLAVVDGVPALLGAGVVPVVDAANLLGYPPLELVGELVNRGCLLYCVATGWQGIRIDSLDKLEREGDGFVYNSVEEHGDQTTVNDLLRLQGGLLALSQWREGTDPFIGRCWATRGEFWFWPDWQQRSLRML